MSDQKISTLLALSLISSPVALPASIPSYNNTPISTAVSSEMISQRASARRMRHQLAPTPVLQLNDEVAKASPSPFFVGELGERWRFPSDHLPVGMSINGLNFANWNILNTAYLGYILSNSQGLKDSLIMETNCIGQDPRLTEREEIILDQVLTLLQHPTSPRALLSLQETGEAFWEVLKERLPPNFKTTTTFPNDLANGDVFIYNSDQFEYVSLQSERYTCYPTNTMMSLTLKERSSGQQYRFIQSHVPGGPVHSAPAREEFADFVMKQFDSSMVLVVMGDMNRPPQDFLNNFARSSEKYSMEQPYKNAVIPYPTHINTHQEASWIDNLFFFTPSKMPVEIAKENSFFPSLQKTINLLQKEALSPSVEREAQAAFRYFLDEVERDTFLTREEQDAKVQEFKKYANQLSLEATSHLRSLLVEETRSRILDMLQNAELDSSEIDALLASNEAVIRGMDEMDVEFAREMLFFVAELKIHRQYIYEIGVALGAPPKQLLHHDLCKLEAGQFEGYVRYFRGGREEADKLAYLAAWELHQHEEHHDEAYSKEGFDFSNFSEERLRNNMLELVADQVAANKQRGGSPLIDRLVNIFPKKQIHPRLLPYIEEGLKKAHAFYLESEDHSEYSLFRGIPCWNSDIEEIFNKLKGC
jgi:hypothetical protein